MKSQVKVKWNISENSKHSAACSVRRSFVSSFKLQFAAFSLLLVHVSIRFTCCKWFKRFHMLVILLVWVWPQYVHIAGKKWRTKKIIIHSKSDWICVLYKKIQIALYFIPNRSCRFFCEMLKNHRFTNWYVNNVLPCWNSIKLNLQLNNRINLLVFNIQNGQINIHTQSHCT